MAWDFWWGAKGKDRGLLGDAWKCPDFHCRRPVLPSVRTTTGGPWLHDGHAITVGLLPGPRSHDPYARARVRLMQFMAVLAPAPEDPPPFSRSFPGRVGGRGGYAP